MKNANDPTDPFSRRRFLGFLAGSPLLGIAGVDVDRLATLFAGTPREQARGFAQVQQAAQDPELISSPAEALSVFDFEPVARKKLAPMPAHWGYLATGTDDDGTLRANREGYSHYALRVRRLVDVSRIDSSIQLLGTKWDTPIVLCPVGSQRAFHPEGEIAVARAAKAKGHLQVLSTVATSSIEDVIAARGTPVWFQLYYQQDWNQTLQMIKRAERAGAPAVVFTVDLNTGAGSNRETMLRAIRVDTRTCTNCHQGGAPLPGMTGRVTEFRDNRRKPFIADLQSSDAPKNEAGTPTWEYVSRIRNATTMKVFVKGIVTREDAELAVQHGASGLFVSNHGGRAENSGRATILSLPEVVSGVRGRVPIVLDGGIRRGTDMFKALGLGATAVGVGRPYIWGLASFGQEGVETVLAILRKELELVMRQAGTTTIKGITRDRVVAS